MQPALLLIILVALGAAAVPYVWRAFLSHSVKGHIKKGDYEKADHLVDTYMYRLLYGAHQQRSDRMNIAIIKDDSDQVFALTKQLLDSASSKKQRYEIASMAFHYFLNKEDHDCTQYALSQLRSCSDVEEYQYDEMLFRIIFEKKSEDIAQLKAMLPQVQDEKQLGYLQYLLGLQYAYINDKTNSKMYFKRAKNHLKGTAYHKKIKKLLEN